MPSVFSGRKDGDRFLGDDNPQSSWQPETQTGSEAQLGFGNGCLDSYPEAAQNERQRRTTAAQTVIMITERQTEPESKAGDGKRKYCPSACTIP